MIKEGNGVVIVTTIWEKNRETTLALSRVSKDRDHFYPNDTIALNVCRLYMLVSSKNFSVHRYDILFLTSLS